MPPLQKLGEAARGSSSGSHKAPGQSDAPRPGQLWKEPVDRGDSSTNTVRVYRWNEFGKEKVTEFDASHFELNGNFESNSSAGHKEFQDRIRAIHFRREGKQRAEIAKILGRPERFVSKWWQKEEQEVPRPWGVHEYLSKEMGRSTAREAASAGAVVDGARSAASWWRDVEVRRKFASDPEIYEELLHRADWVSGINRTRDFATGASVLKYDKEGNMSKQSHQNAKYAQGTSPAFDKCLQRFFAEYGLADRTSGIGLNWYPDGSSNLGSHRHDCWTALFSFGSERILTIDKTPLLCQDGDLVIFGTQRHGVPFMPEITSGRITVPIFFYPDHLQMQKQWQTLTDPEDPRASRKLRALEADRTLGASADEAMLWSDPSRGAALQQLLQLGFEEQASREALLASRNFDPNEAVELLLMAGLDDAGRLRALEQAEGEGAELLAAGAAASEPQALQPRGRWNRSAGGSAAASSSQLAVQPDFPALAAASGAAAVKAESGCHSCSSDGSVCAAAAVVEQEQQEQEEEKAPRGGRDSDEELALRLQAEESWGFSSSSAAGPRPARNQAAREQEDEDAAVALAVQLAEEEQSSMQADFCAAALREEQFQEYEEQLNREDAEKWHGHGDLMQGALQRETLTLPGMDKTTCFTIGHGRVTERDFFELLSLNSIRVLYDFRASDYRGDVHSPCPRFAVRALQSMCKARGIWYKHTALGRESAYGILPHMATDEARHALIELVWHAKRKRTAFLGFEEDWRLDVRQVVANELVKLGHTVKHIDSTGATEDHEIVEQYPHFILQEEEKLRKLDKMRQAGELKRPEKSAVDRSTEAVALRLARPAEAVDAMEELRAARNQHELAQVQRKLARIHRVAETKEGLAAKVVTNTPQWILEEAREQQAWIAQKKAEKLEASSKASKVEASKVTDDADVGAEPVDDLVVDCADCGTKFPWSALAAGDGRCEVCRVAENAAPDCGQPSSAADVVAGVEGLAIDQSSVDAATSSSSSPPDQVAKPSQLACGRASGSDGAEPSRWRRRVAATAP